MRGAGNTLKRRGVALAALLLLAPAQAAGANLEQDRLDCNSAGADLDLQVAACSRLIEKGRLKGAALAFAHYNRAIAHGKKGALDQAIADYGEAIRLNPDDADAYYNRGLAHGKNGEIDQAIEDFKKAYDRGSRAPFLLDKLKESGALP